jgi:hypothetical protein
MRLAGHVAQMGAMGNAYRILFGKPEEKCLFVCNLFNDAF